jgi:uncharacterized protein YggE
MKRTCILLTSIALSHFTLSAQVAGNLVYGNPKAQNPGIAAGDLGGVEAKGSVPISFVEANVLLNLKADHYQAVFALVQEGTTLAAGNDKLASQTGDFMASLEALGVKRADIYVDFVSQNRIYDFAVEEKVARERPSGFEVKKSVVVRYHDAALLDKLLAAAAKSGIFDLVKVNYIVSDLPAARARLLEEASKIIKQKEASYKRLFGATLRSPSVYDQKYNAFFPSDMYKSYTAFESGSADSYNQRVVRSRKTSTFYYSPLDPAEFDAVINPAGVEPMVQLTLYLKIRYR